MIQILNGRWTNQHGEQLKSPEDMNNFTDRLNRVKQYSNGRRLTSDKIKILFSILDSNNATDNALTKLLSMNSSDIKRLF